MSISAERFYWTRGDGRAFVTDSVDGSRIAWDLHPLEAAGLTKHLNSLVAEQGWITAVQIRLAAVAARMALR